MKEKKIRVLYSFPHKLGAQRICHTAWQQVNGLAAAGADVLVFPGVLYRPVPGNVRVRPTLAWGKLRISYKLVGMMRACAIHDYIVARRIEKLVGQIDIIHTWPSASLQTIKTAARLRIPTAMERPSAHTGYHYSVVKEESERLGVAGLLGNEKYNIHNESALQKEEEEFRLAYRLLCPSDFVVRTFLDKGFERKKLVRHIYGFDEKRFYPDDEPRKRNGGLTMLFAGAGGVIKGLHFALEAWINSPASSDGTFNIAGEFLPAYAKKLAVMLAHPSVKVLGHRNDLPDLMRKSDIFVLPSLAEGFGLVCTEAMGSGCVPLVSDACTDICKHMGNALVHSVGDVKSLTRHITMLYQDRALLERLRAGGLKTAPDITWNAAGIKLLEAYRGVMEDWRSRTRAPGNGTCSANPSYT